MKIRNLLLGTALIACASAGPVLAGPIIDWDPAYTWEVGATATNSPTGGELIGVGIVSQFGPPFDDLNAGDPTREYTFHLHGLISQGTVASGSPATTFYVTEYIGGTFELYEDLSPDASFDPNPPNAGVPSDFIGTTLLLAGSFTSFRTQNNNFTAFQTGNMEGDITWTGGSLLSRTFDSGGRPCPGL